MLKKYLIGVCIFVCILLVGCGAQNLVEEKADTVVPEQEEISDTIVPEQEEIPDTREPKEELENQTASTDAGGFTEEIIESLNTFIAPATKGETGTFEDFDKILNSDFAGLWYDPDMQEAVWIKEEGAYVYIPYLNLYGDQLVEWELIDRSQRGLCPELNIYYNGRVIAPLAYYVGGITDDYFWCVSQGQVFYKVKTL